MKMKEKTAIAILTFLLLTASHSILAQQGEFFINPLNINVGAEFDHKADFSKFKYQWEVISRENDIIIPRMDVPSAQIRERFITSSDEIALINSNTDIITIRWNGRKPDGEIPEDGRYVIYVYETANNDSRMENQYTYPVTIITKEISFRISLESSEINRRTNEKLLCTVTSEDVYAYSWRVVIRNSIDGEPVDEQVFRSGQESPFPPFVWNNYGVLDEEIVNYEITVEATDRAGTRFICQNPLAFLIVDRDEITANSYMDELTMQMEQTKLEYEQLLIEREQAFMRQMEQMKLDYAQLLTDMTNPPINKDVDYSWLLSSGYEIYTVRPGDYLAKIALEYYGTAYLWGLIYELNKDNFPRQGEADLILPEMQLRLPPVSVLENLRNSIGQ